MELRKFWEDKIFFSCFFMAPLERTKNTKWHFVKYKYLDDQLFSWLLQLKNTQMHNEKCIHMTIWKNP